MLKCRVGWLQVGAMDELCLHWAGLGDKRSPTTVLRQVQRSTLSTVLYYVVQPGLDSANCAVLLAATADGNLLPPFVVFKVGRGSARFKVYSKR